jgi:sugar lactone lactonase YvrE
MPIRRRSHAIDTAVTTLALLLVGASCSSSTSPSTGSLAVTITPVSGVTPSVVVTGPGGFSQTLSATQTLNGLATGAYTVTAVTGVSSAPVVSIAYAGTVTGNPVAVTAGHQAVATVTYGTRPGSGGLWIVGGTNDGPNVDNAAFEYTAAQLQTSATAAPAVQLNFPQTAGGNIDASGAAIDHAGNLWVVNDNSNTVVEYTAAELASSGTPTPAVTLSLGGADVFAFGIAFDAQGDLWIANNGACTIVEFTPSQLTTSGSPTPAVTITDGQPFTNEPIALAFDAHGNLWVANNASSQVIEYSASQLTTSGSPTPAVTLTGAAILEPLDVAFDSAGNLWVSNSAYFTNPDSTYPQAAGRIVEYAAATLGASGSPTPATVINLPVRSFSPNPVGLAFDNSGNLWYADVYNSRIGEYSTTQLASGGGNLSPAIEIVNPSKGAGVEIAFSPHSAVLPLH